MAKNLVLCCDGTWDSADQEKDKKTGELWVAFVRTDGPNFEPRADMTVVIPDLGTWSWKGLGGKFEVAAKTADSR